MVFNHKLLAILSQQLWFGEGKTIRIPKGSKGGVMRNFFLIVSIVIMVGIGLRPVNAAPNFSGTWRLDVDKSDFGVKTAPKAQMNAVVLNIKQTASKLSIERSTGEVATYNLDGSESVNTLPGGGQSKTTVNWSGDTLAGTTISQLNGVDVKMTDVRMLSSDGKEMVVKLTMQMPSGERKQALVYTRQ